MAVPLVLVYIPNALSPYQKTESDPCSSMCVYTIRYHLIIRQSQIFDPLCVCIPNTLSPYYKTESDL